MYADDHADKIKGLARQFLSIATAPTLDPEDLVRVFAKVRADLDAAEAVAVLTLRGNGHSWADLGAATGRTRQAVQQRYGAACSCEQVPCARWRALSSACPGPVAA